MTSKRTRAGFGHVEARGNTYRAYYTHPVTGKRIRAPHTFATKEPAWAWLAREKTAIDNGTWKSPEELAQLELARETQARLDAYTLGEYADGLMERRRAYLAPSTYRTDMTRYKAYVRPRWGDVPLKAITRRDVRAWVDRELARVGEGQRRQVTALLRVIINNAVDDEFLDVSPLPRNLVPRGKGRGVETARHAPRALSVGEVSALAEMLPQYRVLILTLAYTGLRYGEARELRRKDFDFKTGLLHVSRGVTGPAGAPSVGTPKTRAGMRDVPIPDVLAVEIRAHMDSGGVGFGPDALVFPSVLDPGRHMGMGALRLAMLRACARAGLEPCSPHDLRHTFASIAGRVAGVSERDIQAVLGHENSRMTFDYMRSDVEHGRLVTDGVAGALSRGQTGEVIKLPA